VRAASRRRERDEEARDLREAAKETAGERSLAGEAVRLQELIGNASTTEVIARSPLQRDGAGTEAPAKVDEEPKENATYTMTVADVGTFDLTSWTWATSGDGAGGGGSGPGKANIRDLVSTKRNDGHTAKLMQYASSGQHIKTVELRSQRSGVSLTMKLKDVNITSFQVNQGDPPTETFALTFAEIEYEHSEKGK
jgi:type VI protein secretion system component Hcp